MQSNFYCILSFSATASMGMRAGNAICAKKDSMATQIAKIVSARQSDRHLGCGLDATQPVERLP